MKINRELPEVWLNDLLDKASVSCGPIRTVFVWPKSPTPLLGLFGHRSAEVGIEQSEPFPQFAGYIAVELRYGIDVGRPPLL